MKNSNKVQSQYPVGSLTQRPLRVKDTGFSAGGLTREVVVSGTVFGCTSEVVDISFVLRVVFERNVTLIYAGISSLETELLRTRRMYM